MTSPSSPSPFPSPSPRPQWASYPSQEGLAATDALTQYDLLTRMARLCDTCADIQLEAAKHGERCEITNLFDLALRDGAVSKEEEVMNLWAYFTMASLAAKRQYVAMVDREQ